MCSVRGSVPDLVVSWSRSGPVLVLFRFRSCLGFGSGSVLRVAWSWGSWSVLVLGVLIPFLFRSRSGRVLVVS